MRAQCWFMNSKISSFLFPYFRYVCCILSLNAEVICARVSGLTAKQREMCRTDPDAMVAIGDGVRLARQECRYQFRHQRWNCTAIGNPESFGHVVVVGKFFSTNKRYNKICWEDKIINYALIDIIRFIFDDSNYNFDSTFTFKLADSEKRRKIK